MPAAASATVGHLATRSPRKPTFHSDLTTPTLAKPWGTGLSAMPASPAGLQEADLVICKRSRPALVLHERKTRITLMTRLAGKTAAETIAAMTAAFRRLDPRMRGSFVGKTVHWTVFRPSPSFDNDTCFARQLLLRGMLSAATHFCHAYASWQRGGVENARSRRLPAITCQATNGRIRRWLPRGTDLDEIGEDGIQETAMTINPLPGRGFMETSRRSPREIASATDPPSRRSCRSLVAPRAGVP